MPIQITCVQCGAKRRVNDRLAGRRVRCPECDSVVHVPELEVGQTAQAKSEIEVNPVAVETVARTPALDTTPLSRKSVVSSKSTSESQVATKKEIEEEDENALDQVLPKSNRPEEEMDMTPMVDVTFLLLIFFMVTAAFSMQKSIEMPRQQTDLPSTSVVEDEQDELDVVELQVDEFGGFLVMAPDWERETPGKQNLITALKEAIAVATAGMKLKIQVHELAKLESLVDAMDAGTIAGFAELEVTQVEEF
ncbi:MAG: biopolymer transporter ExbD [Planctomycetota bacterium]|nr:biopolymer transporter ExbD [Planctomycetota bacterium]